MVGAHRIGHACLTLQFDANLDQFDQTLIITPFDTVRLDAAFKKHNIDTSNFVYMRDEEVLERYPHAKDWNLTGDYRGAWLYQQAMKLAAIDMIDADVIFLQDADTFCTKPYQCVVDDKLNLLYLPDTTHAPGYYEAFRNATGLERQTSNCFVCDMMPVFKSDWQALKSHVETLHQTDFLTAFIEQTPWDYVANVKWFSEYEMIGNWVVSQHELYTLTEQHRFEYKKLENLTHNDFPAVFDCISDKNPYGRILPFEYSTDTVLNLDAVMERLRPLLPTSR